MPDNKSRKYNINTLRKMIKVQDITLEHTRRGITQQWVYDNIILQDFYICQSTYYEYLRTPAKALLKKVSKTIK